MLAFQESIVKIVKYTWKNNPKKNKSITFFVFFILDNACWSYPCGVGDICEPEFPNSPTFTCTCKSKYVDLNCTSSNYDICFIMFLDAVIAYNHYLKTHF